MVTPVRLRIVETGYIPRPVDTTILLIDCSSVWVEIMVQRIFASRHVPHSIPHIPWFRRIAVPEPVPGMRQPSSRKPGKGFVDVLAVAGHLTADKLPVFEPGTITVRVE